MGKKRTKSKVIRLSSWRPMTSLKEARLVTSKFHAYTRELESLKNSKKEKSSLSSGKREERVKELNALLEEIGGRVRYQEASILLTSLNSSSAKWVFQNVTKLEMRPRKGEPPLQTLEIGAINTQLLSCSFLDVKAIDLKSRHPKIQEMDFFDLEFPPSKQFDVISNAMVINCVPTAILRGEMLVRCVRMLRHGGLLTLVLPIRSTKSIGAKRLQNILETLGLKVVNTNESPKISFWACVKEHSCWHNAPANRSAEQLLALLNGSKSRKRLATSTTPLDDANPDEVLFEVSFSPETVSRLCSCGRKQTISSLLTE